ncbi:WD40-repeat-containing domain protein [Cristinia sonorae]|uniref:WD40-repeat-containing domain protein n=1 Tax=Cristinia sonorae TaxID=1940300 RepID=A0A8K0XSV8_9AGAR|nr:WD40-repeat-containing domain protein [Cristinia sonorae]
MSRIDELTNRPGDALRTFNRHNSNIRALSCHPENENLLLSASEDGTIKMHDTRVGGHDAQGVLTMAADFTSVQYHPTTPNLFVTGTNTGGVCLRDVRNSFGHGDARVPVATTYVTSLSKSCLPTLYMPEIGSVTFDKTGDKLAVTMLCHQPTIYSLRDPLPLATCSGLNAPNGTPVPPSERTYSNCCTIKHGSFGGAGLPNDSYYSAGSDDFRAYVWKIPELGELTQRREVIAYERWQNLQHALNEDEDGKQRQPLTGFTPRSFKERYVPVELSTPAFRLGGHKSIVNSALIHPTQPLIFTSGVERDILMHSPRPSAPCVSSFEDTPDKVRALPGSPTDGRGMVVRALLAEAEDTGEDRFTIALFDRIIREEGGQDLFSLPDRIWEPSEDEEPDDDDDLYI